MSSSSDTAEREFTLTRIFDAPRELVWRVWTDPKHIVHWWGPSVFTCPLAEVDLRVEGGYRYVMRSPDGSDLPLKGVFLEIVEPERIVSTMDHSELSEEWHELVNPGRLKHEGSRNLDLLSIVTFEALDGRTKLTLRIRFDSAETRDRFVGIGMNEGWNQSLDRFAAEVARS